MRKVFFLLVFLVQIAFPAMAAPAPSVSEDTIVARVNGKSILQSDLVREIDRARTEGRWVHDENRAQKALDQSVLQLLAAERAAKEGLSKDPRVAAEIDQLLAQHYLERRLQKSGTSLTVTDAEVNAAYEKQPLLKLRHIAIVPRNIDEKAEARERMRKVQRLLAGGERFHELANSYSEDPAALPGGELDARGVHNLPAPIYQAALRLSVGKVSPVLELDSAYHLIQLVERKPLVSAPSVYLELLRSRLRASRKEAFLATVYTELKPGAKIEVVREPSQASAAIPLISEETNR